MHNDPASRKSGLLAALFAFILWGLLPIYWKALHHVPPLEILSHRIVWSAVFSAGLITWYGRWAETRQSLLGTGNFKYLAASSSLIAMNWFVYIWAVNSNHVVETSLGYYINPLVNVLLGFLVFRDRLRRLQWLAVILAVAGVVNQVVVLGRFPWISLFLGVTFGLYGLVRKLMRIESLPGLFLETAILTIPAGGFLLFLGATGQGVFGKPDIVSNTLLLGAGVVTSLPLIAFAFSTRRLSLITVGILQYLAPTCMFLLGVFAYGEPFTRMHFMTFACIWSGVLLYTVDGVLNFRRTIHQQGVEKVRLQSK